MTVAAPFDGFARKDEMASWFQIWTDEGEKRLVEVELNGMAAVHAQTGDGRRLVPLKVAARQDGGRMQLLLERQPGQPASHLLRLERPVRIGKVSVAAPVRHTGVKARYRPAAQVLEVQIESLPEAGEGMTVSEALALFPKVRPDPALARVLVQLDVER